MIPAFLLKNPLASVLGILALVFLVGGVGGTVWYRSKWQGAEVTIAQKDAAIAGMQAQQEKNIAAAEKKKIDFYEAQMANNAKLVTELLKEAAEAKEKANAAEKALSEIPVAVTPEGCPDPVSLPVVRAFTLGLPAQ